MTDQTAAPPVEPSPAELPPTVVAARPVGNRWRPLLVIALLLGFLLVTFFLVKDASKINDLKVGDCFDIPSATSVSTVTHHACTEPHTAEVFLVAAYSGTPMDTPLTGLIDDFVGSTCDPAFTTYVGKALADSPELSIGYLYPDPDSWSSGDHTITCYVVKSDQGSMSSSLKGSAAQ